jgi:WD40 repeat protein
MSGDSEGTIRVWDLATGETLKILTGHTGYIQSLAVSADGKKIVSASRDKTIKVWDVETGAEVMTLRGDDYVSSVAISPDGRRIVSVRGDKTIKVCDAETGEELKTLRGIGFFSSSAFSPDGKRIVSGGIYLNVWDSVSGTELMTIHGHKDWITSVSFSSDGKRIISVSRDSIKIWDAETGVEVATLRRGHESITESVAFSPDGRFVVSEPVKELSSGICAYGSLVAESNGRSRPSIFTPRTAPQGC